MQVLRAVRDMHVCVIGGAGFLGSHLVNHLIEDRHCDVLVVDNLLSGQTKHVHKEAKFKLFDITESHHVLERIISSHGSVYVFNYAAMPYIPQCFDDPDRFFRTNALGVLNVLNASQAAGVRGVLQVSSAEIYGDMAGKIKESDPITPHSTYGVSKLAADGLVQVRWREAQVPAIALRQFNCLGERETHEYVIPEIISQLARRNVVHLGNNSTRDFIYAGDAVRMAVELLEMGTFGQVYNLGSEECIKIYDLAEMIGRLMGYDHITIEVDAKRIRPWEIWHLQSDNTKIHNTIPTRPQVSLEEALRRTIEFYKSNGMKWDW